MITQVCAMYDSKARAFAPPFTVVHLDIALRVFTDVANMPNHQCSKHPEDFSLFHLGNFNDETAEFKLLPQPAVLGIAAQFKKPTTGVSINVQDKDA